MKQLTCQKSQIIEKVTENENGLFLARFLVVEVAGTTKWKLLEVTEIENTQSIKISGEVLLLAAPVIGEVYEIDESRPEKVVSPYSSLSFFISQPTRAPNF
jgi:hypothetical protein